MLTAIRALRVCKANLCWFLPPLFHGKWSGYAKWLHWLSQNSCQAKPWINMMTSSNGNIFRVTGPLWGEFTGDRWIPLTKASDAELWCFIWSAPEPVIWDAIALIMTSLQWFMAAETMNKYYRFGTWWMRWKCVRVVMRICTFIYLFTLLGNAYLMCPSSKYLIIVMFIVHFPPANRCEVCRCAVVSCKILWIFLWFVSELPYWG